MPHGLKDDIGTTRSRLLWCYDTVAMRVPWHPFRFPYRSLRRWLAHPIAWALFFLGPTLNLVRVDMISQQVIYVGKTYPFTPWTIAPIPIGFYGLVILIALVTAAFGRLFCGWACPHNIISENTRYFRAALGIEAKPTWMRRWEQRLPLLQTLNPYLSIILGVGLCYGLTFLLFHMVMPWSALLDGYLAGNPHPALVMGQVLFTMIGLFLLYSGHLFCKSACPYGMAQSASAYQGGKWRPMELVYTGNPTDKADACGTCTACQQVCPVDIDPRGDGESSILKVGTFWGCWNCGECVDACKTVMHYRKQPSLLGFKLPWQKTTLQRPKVG